MGGEEWLRKKHASVKIDLKGQDEQKSPVSSE